MTKKQKSMAAASSEPPKMAVVMDVQPPVEFIDDAEPRPPAVDDIRQSSPTPESFGESGPVMAGQPLQVEIERDRLWELYVARVAKAETVNTMRRDPRAIFRDAFLEAKFALDVYNDLTKGSEL